MSKRTSALRNAIRAWIESNPVDPKETTQERHKRAYRATPIGIIEDAIDYRAAVRRIFDIEFNKIANTFTQRSSRIIDEDGIRNVFIDQSTAELDELWQAFELRRENKKRAAIKLREAATHAAEVYIHNHPACGLSIEKIVGILEDAMEDVG